MSTEFPLPAWKCRHTGRYLRQSTAQATFRATDPAGNVYATTGRLVTVAAPDGATNAESFAVPAARAPASDPCGDGQVRCFNPVFYAVDTVVPLVTLGQRSTWYPNRAAPWGAVVDTWLNIATLLGWVLSSIFLLSFTREPKLRVAR